MTCILSLWVGRAAQMKGQDSVKRQRHLIGTGLIVVFSDVPFLVHPDLA